MTGRRGRGYSWEPFGAGNRAAERHGAWSERRIAPLAERLAAELAESAPWTCRPAYRATVAAWARAEVRVQLIERWLDEVGDLDELGRPRAASGWLDRLESRAMRLRSELGLSPQSLARLLLSTSELVRGQPDRAGPLASALEDLVAEARAALDAGAERAVGDGRSARGGGELPAAGATDEGPEQAAWDR